jgi:hypothetical protein
VVVVEQEVTLHGLVLLVVLAAVVKVEREIVMPALLVLQTLVAVVVDLVATQQLVVPVVPVLSFLLT